MVWLEKARRSRHDTSVLTSQDPTQRPWFYYYDDITPQTFPSLGLSFHFCTWELDTVILIALRADVEAYYVTNLIS